MTDNWIMGECVSPDYFTGPWKWADYDEAVDRINGNTFLGRWKAALGDGSDDRVAYCAMGENGDVFAYGHGGDEEPTWRLVRDPDQVLVPIAREERRRRRLAPVMG